MFSRVVANRAAPTVSRRNFGKEKRSSNEVRDRFKDSGDGIRLLLASSAFAATKASLELKHPTTVNGTQLKPGEYKLQWDGTGPER